MAIITRRGSAPVRYEPVKRTRATAAVIGIGLLVAACGGSGSGSDEPAATGELAPIQPLDEDDTVGEPAAEPAGDATADPPAGDAVTVPAALQFSAPLVGGGELDAATLAGAPTVFWFWAPT